MIRRHPDLIDGQECCDGCGHPSPYELCNSCIKEGIKDMLPYPIGPDYGHVRDPDVIRELPTEEENQKARDKARRMLSDITNDIVNAMHRYAMAHGLTKEFEEFQLTGIVEGRMNAMQERYASHTYRKQSLSKIHPRKRN